MTEEEYTRKYFNKVETMTAVCKTNSSWSHGDHPELEIGKTYQVSQIGVLKSITMIRLAEFGNKEYSSGCFELFENGESIDRTYTQDPRFWAPYLRNSFIPSYLAEQIETIAIPAHLRAIEYEYDVKILLAVESGSRAWGFESDNSDWDVRFIYVHKPEWYFNVDEQRDVIEHVYEDNVDLAGWELRKSLALFRKSNPSLLEWLNSPKVYYVDPVFVMRMREVEKDFFNPIKAMYHYNHIYIRHDERYLQKQGYPMKRYLYYLRGILACQWIEKYKTLPPVSFWQLYEDIVEDKKIKDGISEMIKQKSSGKDKDMREVPQYLVDYYLPIAEYYSNIVGNFRPGIDHEGITERLNHFFYETVTGGALDHMIYNDN